MKNIEYSWYKLSNAPSFGSKSIHYIYDNLRARDMNVNDLFVLEMNELYQLFPEIGKGKFSKVNFSCFSTLDNETLYSSFLKLKDNHISIIGLDNNQYPQSVIQNMKDNAPPVLYCKGHSPLLNQKGVSIVGARDVSDYETSIAKEIAHLLAEQGLNITSGYAKGVDTSAHIGALEAQGTTTMILSSGTNYISIKREIQNLNWQQNSLFVTQFAPYEKFSGHNAMTRNKLVCAMSKAIVVIKSGQERDSQGKMSGTFDAGKSALQMGIPVFVLSPRAITPTPQGNVDLIKLGGIEFSNGRDILNVLEKHSHEKSNNVSIRKNINTKSIISRQLSLF
ncbi:hypothetical protein FACS1894176_08220 [Bacteroidia bacterium]|nr:hypothetical protein FACS1894176_08220 [Bacteroidia bacterium]